jgi:hypothetical protein
MGSSEKEARMELLWVIVIVLVAGAAGGFVNVFIGDNGLHLPKLEHGVWRPGYLGTVFVGTIAAIASWATVKSVVLLGADAQAVSLSTGDLANALAVGFGGAKWWKSETEKDVLQRTAAVAASKNADPSAASEIAVNNPFEALSTALKMK